jgi:S1-C subfamily serine protease
MGLGGLRLVELTGRQRDEAKLAGDGMALQVSHLGEYGEHAVAKRAGLRKGDVLVSFDGLAGRTSESELLAYAMQRKRAGDEVAVTVLRNGKRETLKFVLQ